MQPTVHACNDNRGQQAVRCTYEQIVACVASLDSVVSPNARANTCEARARNDYAFAHISIYCCCARYNAPEVRMLSLPAKTLLPV